MATTESTTSKETATQPTRETDSRRAFMVAAMVAAIVLIAGVGTWAVLSSNETTLGAAPERIAAAYMDARNDYDADAALALLSSTVTMSDVPIVDSLDEVAPSFDYLRRLEATFDYECTETRPGTVSEVVCDYELDTKLSQIVGYRPVRGAFRFQISGGQIVDLIDDFPFEEYSPNVWTPFAMWLDSTHPGKFLTVFRITEDEVATPILTQEALDQLTVYFDEFEASRN